MQKNDYPFLTRAAEIFAEGGREAAEAWIKSLSPAEQNQLLEEWSLILIRGISTLALFSALSAYLDSVFEHRPGNPFGDN